ncbi:MAG TPA: asparagine synthase (glutamine-hydrolyzing) [Rhodanobacteraceae bacterium]
MCGICGAWTLGGAKPVPELEVRVRTMLAAMTHRGPRGDSVICGPGLVMGVNRLAIRKVNGQYPPLVGSGTDVLVACNGEIDNYRTLQRSLESSGRIVPPGSDIAVIAPLYQDRELDFPKCLQGVFAIALWDAQRQRLILARDRAGERHLHYLFVGGIVYFASELGALLTVPGVRGPIDAVTVKRYLLSGYCPAPRDPVAGCRKVRPGELVVIEASMVRHHRFWNPPLGVVPKATPAPETFDRIFREAVRRQTDVEVPYGMLLSGGVDSALITAVARSVRPDRPLVAYCARFAEPSFDEGDPASRVARMLGCDFVPVDIAPEEVPGTLRHLIESTGELLADPAWIPHALVARRASADVPMLLGGEGADELFGGYPTYLGASIAERYARVPKVIRGVLRRLVERLPVSSRNMTISFLLKRFVEGEGLDGLARHIRWTANIAPAWLHRVGLDPTPLESTADDRAAETLDAIQRHDFTQSLPEALLAKADRGGMCYGVEVRAPFLDTNVVEFAATLPVPERVHGLATKVFLKRYARQYLPGSVVDRRKRGLSVPLGTWLRGPLYDWARACLASDDLHEVGIDNRSVLRLLAEHRSRQRDHAKAVWTLIVLSEWLGWCRHLDEALTAGFTAGAQHEDSRVAESSRSLR